MTPRTAARTHYVVCDDYVYGPMSQTAAERDVARLAAHQADPDWKGCRNKHHVSDHDPREDGHPYALDREGLAGPEDLEQLFRDPEPGGDLNA